MIDFMGKGRVSPREDKIDGTISAICHYMSQDQKTGVGLVLRYEPPVHSFDGALKIFPGNRS